MSVTKKMLPSHSVMVQNILSAYNNATEEDISEGMEWYEKAWNICLSLAEVVPYTATQCAAVMAIMSPGMVWDENQEAPGRVLDLHMEGIHPSMWLGFSTYPNNKFKAERALNGDLTAVRGNKVTNFFHNILGDKHYSVTVDRWAVRIALNDPKISGNQAVPSSKGSYRMIADAYKDAAEVAGIPVRELQAVTWVAFKRIYGGRIKYKVNRYKAMEEVVV